MGIKPTKGRNYGLCPKYGAQPGCPCVDTRRTTKPPLENRHQERKKQPGLPRKKK